MSVEDAGKKRDRPDATGRRRPAWPRPGDRDRGQAIVAGPDRRGLLRDYLADALSPEDRRGSRRPCATRPSSAAGSRTSATTASDSQLHTLGAIWHRARLTCPGRQQLGSFLLDALDPDLAGYISSTSRSSSAPSARPTSTT